MDRRSPGSRNVIAAPNCPADLTSAHPAPRTTRTAAMPQRGPPCSSSVWALGRGNACGARAAATTPATAPTRAGLGGARRPADHGLAGSRHGVTASSLRRSAAAASPRSSGVPGSSTGHGRRTDDDREPGPIASQARVASAFGLALPSRTGSTSRSRSGRAKDHRAAPLARMERRRSLSRVRSAIALWTGRSQSRSSSCARRYASASRPSVKSAGGGGIESHATATAPTTDRTCPSVGSVRGHRRPHTSARKPRRWCARSRRNPRALGWWKERASATCAAAAAPWKPTV